MRLFTSLLLALFVICFGWLQQYSAPLYDGDVFYLEDRQGSLGIDDIKSRDWPRSALSPVNIGYNPSVFWFYLPLPDAMLRHGGPQVVEIDFPTIDRLEFFHVDAAGRVLKHVVTGTDQPFSSRPFLDDDWVFLLDRVQPGDRVFLRAATTNSLQMPIRLYDREAFLQQDMFGLLFWGAFYGLALTMAAYSFLNGLVIRDLMYLYYSAYVLASVITSAALNGHAFAWLWPDTPALNKVSLTVFPCLVVCFGTAFTLEYLGLTRTRAPERFMGLAFILTALGTACAALLLHRDLSFWAAVEVVMFSVVVFLLGLLSVLRGYYLGWYFLTGWFVFLVGSGMFALNVLGLLPFTTITIHSKEVGSAFEIIMLSLGMSAIYSHEKKERYRIDNSILGMNQRLQRRFGLGSGHAGALEIPRLEKHWQDIRNLDRSLRQDMQRLLVVAVQVLDKDSGQPDFIAQADCLRGLLNSGVSVLAFSTRREESQGDVTVLLFPLHNKFEAEPVLERIEDWRLSLGNQYDLHFGYTVSHLTEKDGIEYIDEALHYLDEAIQQGAVAYSIDDSLGFVARQQVA